MRLRPGDPPAATLALVAAVALQEVAAAYAPDADVRIKWPNDLLVGGAKLSGILLERHDDAVVIGFGVNLASHPDDTPRPATSLAAFAGSAPDVDGFLADLVDGFAGWLSRWRGDGLEPVRVRWLARAHPPGTALSVVAAGQEPIDGLFDGLDERGGLRLRLADGTSHVIQAGDIFLI